MKLRNIMAASAVLALTAVPAFATPPVNTPDTLYVADYGTGNLLRYSATLNTVGGYPQEVLTAYSVPPTGNTSTNPFVIKPPTAGAAIKEGIAGTSNDIITIVKTASGPNELARYNTNGTFNSYVGGGATTFSGVGSFVITPNAQFAYVADSAAGKLYRVSLTTGLVVNSVSLASVHDVAVLPDGSVVAEKLNGGIWKYTAALGSPVNIVPQGTGASVDTIGSAGNLQGHNQYGFAIDASGNIWTVSDDRSGGPGNAPNTSGTLYEYSSTGVFLGSWTPTPASKLAVGTFGLSFGADGNLYLSDIGNVVLSPSPGTDQVDEFNVYTDTFSTYINGADGTTPNAITGLAQPKYANWQSDFVPSPDPGYTVPEPSGVATSIAFVGIVGLLIAGAKRKASRSL